MRAPSALRACVALLAVAIAAAVAPPPPSPSPPPLPPGASLSVSPLVVGELAFSGDAFVNAYTPAVRNAIVAAVARAVRACVRNGPQLAFWGGRLHCAPPRGARGAWRIAARRSSVARHSAARLGLAWRGLAVATDAVSKRVTHHQSELPLTAVTVPFEFFSAELTLRLASTASPVSDALLAALATAVGSAANVSASLAFPVDGGAAGGGAADVDVAVHTSTAAAAATAKAALTSATAALLAAATTAAGHPATLVGTIDRAVVATFRAQLPVMSTPRTADAAAAVVVANITDAVTSGSLTVGFATLQAPVSLRQGPSVNKVLTVLDPSRPPPNSAPPRSPPPPRPPPPAPGAAAKPTYVGDLSKQELSAIIICSVAGAIGCCVLTALCACVCYRRGVSAAEHALQRDIAEHKLAPPPRQHEQTAELESIEVDDLATDGASSMPRHHEAPPSPPERRKSRLGPDGGDVPAPTAEITPAQAGSSPRVSLTSSSPRVSLSSDTRRLSSPGSRGAALLAASGAEDAASPAPRVSQQAVAEPVDDAPPVAQPPPWATSSFDNPLRHDDEAHEAHEENVDALGSPHEANAAAWHALGSPAPPAHGDGHNPLFDDTAPHPAWEQLAPAGAATPSSDTTAGGFDAFATPSEGGAAYATPGSALSDASASARE